MTEYNFIHQDLQNSWIVENLFGEFSSNDIVIWFTDQMNLEHCMVAAKLFPSNSQSRKNGWGGPIPGGFGWARKFGKSKLIWTLNKMKYQLIEDYFENDSLIWSKGEIVYLDHKVNIPDDLHLPMTKNTLEDEYHWVEIRLLNKVYDGTSQQT